MRKRVYCAGPISLGNQADNVQAGINAGLTLLRAGYAPFIPHLSHFATPAATVGTVDYEHWLATDMSYIATCHALLRLAGVSDGADREVRWAKDLGIPVYHTVEDVLAHLR